MQFQDFKIMFLEIFTSRSRAQNPFPSSEYLIPQLLRFPDDSGTWWINDLFAPSHAYCTMRDMSMEFLLWAIYPELRCQMDRGLRLQPLIFQKRHCSKNIENKIFCLAQFNKLIFFIHNREKFVTLRKTLIFRDNSVIFLLGINREKERERKNAFCKFILILKNVFNKK